MTVEIGSLPERTVDPRTGKIGAPEPIAALNRVNAPDFEAVASNGKGVMETLKTISKTIVTTLKGGEI